MASSGIKILHTSDWHLGRQLYEHSREDEFEAFLTWMLNTIEQEHIDVLVIAGDIFDTGNVAHAVQQKYYDFCEALSHTCCRHTIVIAGNHDSSVFIDAPASLLKKHRIHVVGQPRFNLANNTGNPADEVIELKNDAGETELIVAAVPYLTDRDIRMSCGGESQECKESKMVYGVIEHYRLVAEEAEKIRAGRDIPVIATGHLFAVGGIVTEDDGVRQTYVGNLGGISASAFPEAFDYVALGHLHVPQIVGDCEHIRYSGSPLPMGFGEAGQDKQVCLIDFEGRNKEISIKSIPCFHNLAKLTGDTNEILIQMNKLVNSHDDYYVDVSYLGDDNLENIRALIDAEIEKSEGRIICLRLHMMRKQVVGSMASYGDCISLREINPERVFDKFMELNCTEYSEDQKDELLNTYKELLASINMG